MTVLATWLARLDDATRAADAAEAAVRAEFAHRVALAADARAVAYRRRNLAAGLAEIVAPAADAREAEARGIASLQARFGWDADPASPHGQVAALFAPVCGAIWRAGTEAAADGPTPARDGGGADGPGEVPPTVEAALDAFERAYAARTGTSFWILFDNPMPETPRVDY